MIHGSKPPSLAHLSPFARSLQRVTPCKFPERPDPIHPIPQERSSPCSQTSSSCDPHPQTIQTGNSISPSSASSSAARPGPPRPGHRCPRPPFPRRCRSRSGGLRRTPQQRQIRTRLQNPHQCSHRPRRHCHGERPRHRCWRGRHLGGRRRAEHRTVGSVSGSWERSSEGEKKHTSSAISFLVLMPLARKKFSRGCCSSLDGYDELRSDMRIEATYRLMLLNWCSAMPPFIVKVISNVRLAAMAPPTRDMVTEAMLSMLIYVAGLGMNINALSKQKR